MSKTYVTKLGDMWDEIAYNELGDESFIVELMAANLDHADTVIFDSGIELTIPDVETTQQTGVDSSLPPWRQ